MPELQDLATLKQQLLSLGVNSRGWRLFAEYGYSIFEPLGTHFCDLECEDVRGDNEVAWLKILQACEMDVLPPPELVRSLAKWHIPGAQLSVIPPLFLRLVWKACTGAVYKNEPIDTFINSKLIPMAKWFFLTGIYKTVDAAHLKAGWSCLERLRRAHAVEHAKSLGKDDWPPIVRYFETAGLCISALSHAHQLADEGNVMGHCVGDYVDRCRFEPLRIFSIRYKKTQQRVATLSIRETKPGAWSFDQLKGPRNASVETHVWQAADSLIQAMNRASLMDLKSRQFLDFIHSL